MKWSSFIYHRKHQDGEVVSGHQFQNHSFIGVSGWWPIDSTCWLFHWHANMWNWFSGSIASYCNWRVWTQKCEWIVYGFTLFFWSCRSYTNFLQSYLCLLIYFMTYFFNLCLYVFNVKHIVFTRMLMRAALQIKWLMYHCVWKCIVKYL